MELPQAVTDVLDSFLSGDYVLPTYGKQSLVPEFPCGYPSLLLSSLDEEYLGVTKLRSSIEKAQNTRYVALLGTSGSGKTRTLYSHYWKVFGVYFIASNMGQGGSGDMAALTDSLPLQAGMFEENMRVTRAAVQLLLAVRLKILAYCKSKQITPQQWLLLQVACNKGFVSKNDGKRMSDIFLRAWKAAWRAHLGVLFNLDFATGIGKEVEQLLAETGHPDVAVDEVQRLLNRFSPGYFGGQFPLARDVLGGLRDASQTHRVIASGTGLSIISSIRDLLSGPGRLAAPDVEALVLYDGWTSAAGMIS